MMMSPNEGLEEEELCFNEGDIIKVCCFLYCFVNLKSGKDDQSNNCGAKIETHNRIL